MFISDEAYIRANYLLERGYTEDDIHELAERIEISMRKEKKSKEKEKEHVS